MRWMRGRKPSPAMMVACAALGIALVGTAMAAPIAVKSVLSSPEKKQVKKIAKNQVNSLASGLSVANATNANNAQNATSAANANALQGSALAGIAPVVNAADADCQPAAAFATDCTGATLTITRTSDVLMTVAANWHSDDATGSAVQTDCRIERNDATTSQNYNYGTDSDDTTETARGRSVAITDVDANLAPGTYLFELSCDVNTGDFDLENVETTAVGLGS